MVNVYQRRDSEVPKMPLPSLPDNYGRKLLQRPPLQPIQDTFFIGSTVIKPKFIDQVHEDGWYPVLSNIPGAGSMGEINVQILYRKLTVSQLLSVMLVFESHFDRLKFQ